MAATVNIPVEKFVGNAKRLLELKESNPAFWKEMAALAEGLKNQRTEQGFGYYNDHTQAGSKEIKTECFRSVIIVQQIHHGSASKCWVCPGYYGETYAQCKNPFYLRAGKST